MRIKTAIVILLLLVPVCLRAQLSRSSPYENRIIMLIQADPNTLKRIIRYDTKYFYVAGGEGVKLRDPFGQSNFYYTAAATSLPLGNYFKLGTSFYLMTVRSSSTGAWRWSQRLNLDGTFRYKTESGWIFTCRERLQYTHKSYYPGLLDVRNAFLLRSKFQVKYQGFSFPLACYAFVELRNTLNKPAASVQDGELAPGRGYDVFINRIKWSVCAEWKITDRHTLCLYGLFDYDINRKYFVTADNTVSYDLDEDFLPAIGIRFKHLF